MNHAKESLNVLRHAGEQNDDALHLADVALALATIERPEVGSAAYLEHLAVMETQLRAEGPASRTEDQLRFLRRVIVMENAYQGAESLEDDLRAFNLIDTIDRRRGSPITLGLLYLHLAERMGWAMTGVDLAGHFLLRLSARDGSVIIDPFRAGQLCQIEEVDASLLDDEDEGEHFEILTESSPLDFSSDLIKPLSKRDVLLRLQHQIKRRHLLNDKTESAIKTLQSMILFAPRRQELWREMGYLQAERGQIRAAITSLEVVRDLAAGPMPVHQTDGMLRELRWRLN